jgi:hypothetical protein
MANPYREGERVNVLNSAVVYLDILGVKAALKAGTSLGRQHRDATSLRKALDRCWPELVPNHEEDLNLLKASAFTDNVVVGIPIRADLAFEEGDLGSALLQVAAFQLEMVLCGYPLRGAIDIGTLYLDDQMAWGTGLLRAYAAEHEFALEPRVILTRSALKLVSKHLGYYGQVEESPHFVEILIDRDARPFINYLEASDLGEGDGPEPSDIAKHREVVVNGLEKHLGDRTIHSKFVWMAHYHNYFCSLYHRLKKLTIQSTLLSYKFSRLPASIGSIRVP